MKILKEIHLKTKRGNKILFLGMPNTNEELKEMFKLRYDIYSKLGYISKDSFPQKVEQDDYDNEKKCDYFIAKIDDQIVGSARLIQDYYLPTEKECFKFEEPPEMKNIPREKRGEIGRLIVSKRDNNFLPPHLVLLGILDSIMRFSFQKDLRAGFSFVKKSLMEKLKKLRVPFHVIKSYTQIYSKKHLWGYFHDPKDPVLPVYYFRDEAKKYLNTIFNNNKIFKKIGKKEFLYLPSNSWKFLFYIRLSSIFH
jgi:N-acyl-L-homoserine lactone synthetase